MLPTTRSLQKAVTDFMQAMNDIGDMLSTIQSLRTQDGFHKLFQEASNVAETFLDYNMHNEATDSSRSVNRAAAAATAGDTADDYYRIKVFYPAVDSILRDLELCFDPKQKMSMNLSHLIPAAIEYETEAAWKQLESGIAVYSDFLTDPTPAMKSEFFFCGNASGRSVC